MEDKTCSMGHNIDSPEVIQCNFATTLIEEGWLISNYESVPVMILSLEHGKNFMVSDFWKSTYKMT